MSLSFELVGDDGETKFNPQMDEDYATLVIHPGAEDSFTVTGNREDGIEIRLPLFNYEAEELRAKLVDLAEQPSQ